MDEEIIVDESSISGEYETKVIDPDDFSIDFMQSRNVLLMESFVLSGSGMGIVLATGKATLFG